MSWDNDYIATLNGNKFWPLTGEGKLDIHEIAHALGMICRFNGHVIRFLSVAEHCVLVSKIVPEEYAFDGLMHDAAEAYLGDVISPLKCNMTLCGESWKKAEYHIEKQIAKHCGIPWPCDPSIKTLDLTLLATEKRDLMKKPPQPWLTLPKPLTCRILTVLQPEFAERTFLREYKNLLGR